MLIGISYICGSVLVSDLAFSFNWRQAVHFLVAAPILEEAVFRGIFQKELLHRWKPRWFGISAANLTTSVLFSLFHLFGNDVLHSALVFFPSILFGLVYERYRSVYPAMALHSIYNLNVFWVV